MAEKLREACVRGEAERVARLLDEGIKPQPDENGRSPLLLAAALGHTDVCNALLLREAEVNAADSAPDRELTDGCCAMFQSRSIICMYVGTSDMHMCVRWCATGTMIPV
ncbi:hypothetical protein HZH66_000535 [Vespula vulgaris]|uniref:Uncharacterized protein n=1 Tax=Vespula vulgaris TaxID=7454 RepID=A0A834KP99_VESVU|nr:hypothetical protein HZH66_000535 [Vespula vulgaris]